MPLTFDKDQAGFPMVWVEVEEVKLYVHWLPVTKIQFEYFMCDAPDRRFDATWYDTILQLNARVSPHAMRLDNYWRAFLSGVKPSEGQAFARWCGEGYRLPTLTEWNIIYRALKQKAPIADAIGSMKTMRDRIRATVEQFEKIGEQATAKFGYNRTLADQMFMRLGVMEWVEASNLRNRWGGMGETGDFHDSLFTPDMGQPQAPTNPETQRLSYYGIRLVRSKL